MRLNFLYIKGLWLWTSAMLNCGELQDVVQQLDRLEESSKDRKGLGEQGLLELLNIEICKSDFWKWRVDGVQLCWRLTQAEEKIVDWNG